MNREEAIEVLEFMKAHAIADEFRETLDMAISALQGGDAEMNPIPNGTGVMQETPSKDGSDLISRSDAIADRPTGEWKTDTVYAGIGFYRCDKCDFRQSEKSRYCPNCGARMVKGGDDE